MLVDLLKGGVADIKQGNVSTISEVDGNDKLCRVVMNNDDVFILKHKSNEVIHSFMNGFIAIRNETIEEVNDVS